MGSPMELVSLIIIQGLFQSKVKAMRGYYRPKDNGGAYPMQMTINHTYNQSVG